jgi:hypothetical protein
MGEVAFAVAGEIPGYTARRARDIDRLSRSPLARRSAAIAWCLMHDDRKLNPDFENLAHLTHAQDRQWAMLRDWMQSPQRRWCEGMKLTWRRRRAHSRELIESSRQRLAVAKACLHPAGEAMGLFTLLLLSDAQFNDTLSLLLG